MLMKKGSKRLKVSILVKHFENTFRGMGKQILMNRVVRVVRSGLVNRALKDHDFWTNLKNTMWGIVLYIFGYWKHNFDNWRVVAIKHYDFGSTFTLWVGYSFICFCSGKQIFDEDRVKALKDHDFVWKFKNFMGISFYMFSGKRNSVSTIKGSYRLKITILGQHFENKLWGIVLYVF